AAFVAFRDAAKPVWNEEDKQKITDAFNIMVLAFARKRLIDTVRRNALHEPMTHLPNANGFIEHARHLQEIGTLTLYNGYYFNLKGFGLVNRRFGKEETDRIIIRYAKILQDFIGGEECVGRLGGDNFVALIRRSRTNEFLNLIGGAETFGTIDGEDIPVVIQAAAGVWSIDEELRDPGQILGKCGTALHIAKHVAKVPFVFVTPELNSRVYQQKQIAEQFPDALANKEFKVFYQPKVDTKTNNIIGAEALVRWLSNGEIIPPGEFIPIIESDGNIVKLDFYVLENVCSDIRSWIDSGIEPVRISTNFSRRNLSDPEFAEHILGVIEKYHVPREYIEVEVTETTDEEESGLLSRFMHKMHDAKVTTAIDDFGTGYSSLNILRDFPVDVLKIDKSFIDHHTNTLRDNVVLSNVVKMAQELHMDVITEGVENWDQVEFLKNIGSNVVQGFLFDKPMPEESFKKRLQMKHYDIQRS
ncbi:MAG: GGDEF domain-containing protein, partial [Lachnospiraceae bacterium]|nr:GGDEF domain-containing protein [Lachnospiraceae bacterium]